MWEGDWEGVTWEDVMWEGVMWEGVIFFCTYMPPVGGQVCTAKLLYERALVWRMHLVSTSDHTEGQFFDIQYSCVGRAFRSIARKFDVLVHKFLSVCLLRLPMWYYDKL